MGLCVVEVGSQIWDADGMALGCGLQSGLSDTRLTNKSGCGSDADRHRAVFLSSNSLIIASSSSARSSAPRSDTSSPCSHGATLATCPASSTAAMRSTASSSSLSRDTTSPPGDPPSLRISMDCAGGDGRLSLPTGPRPPGLPEADRPHLPVSSLDGSRQGVALQERLGSKEIYLSLLFLVGLPYLSAKATDYWERIGGGIDAAGGDDALFGDDNNHDEDVTEGTPAQRRLRFADDDENENGSRRSRRAKRLARARQLSSSTFRRGYPHAAAAYQLWLLGYNLSYLFQRTPYWRPWFSLMRVDVRRMGADDYPDTPPLIPPNAPSPFNTPSAFSRPCSARRPSSSSSRSNTRSPLAFSSSSSSSGGTALTIPDEDAVEAKEEEATLGLVKMTAVEQEGRMEMYPSLVRPGPSSPPHAESSTAQTQQNSALLPAAAADKGKNKDQGPIMRAPLEHNACPICGAAPINNPAMFPTAYVACFVCAQDYVEREARCPVTRERVRGGVSALRKVLG
ncbi:hypothetical protein CF328_g6953 [Tilletia controversa]|nr:hypothetical protein CF328_g6953 [Tilletia controversa]